MKCDKATMRLYAVTDSAWVGAQTLLQQVESALQGGATCVQLREKHLDYDAFLAQAIAMNKLCKAYNVPFIVNDSVEIALASGADGVHVGQMDMDGKNVRALLGADKLVGISAATVDQALAAQASGADYLGVGAVFATTTKLDAKPVPHATLKAICQAVSIPVVAIGGIYMHNIKQLSGTGVDGVALVSAIFSATDITAQCKQLRTLAEEMATSPVL